MLVKVLTPAFYARKDVKTPVRIAMSVLGLGILANFLLIPVMGIYSLATVTSAGAWINFVLLFGILYATRPFPHAGLAGRPRRPAVDRRRWRWPRRCYGVRTVARRHVLRRR